MPVTKRRRGPPRSAEPSGSPRGRPPTAPASAGSGSRRPPPAGCIPPTCASVAGRARRRAARPAGRRAATGAGPRGTDLARSLLAAHAAGIDPALITAERNFVAETLALFDGRRLYDPGAASSLSDDIFGTLGLAAAGAPQPVLDALAGF